MITDTYTILYLTCSKPLDWLSGLLGFRLCLSHSDCLVFHILNFLSEFLSVSVHLRCQCVCVPSCVCAFVEVYENGWIHLHVSISQVGWDGDDHLEIGIFWIALDSSGWLNQFRFKTLWPISGVSAPCKIAKNVWPACLLSAECCCCDKVSSL